jgi:tricorn protease
MRMPDIQGDHIVFVYAGDLWTLPRAGGVAQRLTTHEGQEVFPKLSPDGNAVAFTGEYDGNVDTYTIPYTGGEPKRITFHPGPDVAAEWYPDGKSLLLRTPRASNVQRYTRFFKVPATGGFEQMLALPTAGYASFSADANLLAFVSPTYDNRTWKRYRGGNAPNIWVYDFKANSSQNITADWAGPDEWPMFHGRTVYYCSDRNGKTANVWAYDLDKKTHRQVTQFTDYDVKWPSVGADAIVFENGGWLYVMDLPSEKVHKLSVQVPDDKPATRAEYRSVADWMNGFDMSPSAKRAVIEARGELFTVPAEKGDVRDLTNTPGARERDPAWSPDGKWIAYLSDESGEYQIHVIGADGKTPGRQVTKEPGTFRFAPMWSAGFQEARVLRQDAEALLGGRSLGQGDAGGQGRVQRDPPVRVVAGFALARVRQDHGRRLRRGVAALVGQRQVDRGHRRHVGRLLAVVRSRWALPVLPLAPHVQARVRRVRAGHDVLDHGQAVRDDAA